MAEQPEITGFTLVLNNFEGPFDLLLTLIARRRLDVTELALAEVIDDFLATDVSAFALAQVFNLLVKREHSSTVIVSQHEPEYWYSVFSENAIADAVLSRLANNGSKLTLIGEDMRTRDDFQEERGTLSKQLKQRQRSKR